MPQTTIRSLPFELLEHILDLAAGEADLDSKRSIFTRYNFLRAAALVSSDFRYPAQSCLWLSLRVHSPETAKRLLNSKALKHYITRDVSLEGVHSGSDGLSGSTGARVLKQLRGIRCLRLMDFGRLSLKVLQNENLSSEFSLVGRLNASS